MKKILPAFFFILFFFAHPAFADEIHDGELFLATGNGEIQKVQALLAQGANPSVYNSESGFSALMAACMFSDDTLARILIQSGANVNQRTVKGETALYYAVVRNNSKISRLLLANGADSQIKTTDGRTIYQIARLNGNTQLMALLRSSDEKITMDTYPEINTGTSLTLLDERRALRAQAEAADTYQSGGHIRSLLVYPLNFKYMQVIFDEMLLNKKSSPKVTMITPYSLLRYTYAQAMQQEVVPDNNDIDAIYKHSDVVWLLVEPGKSRPYIDKVTLRIGKKEYPPLARTLYTPHALLKTIGVGASNVWAFPINAFSVNTPLTEIVVTYPNGKKHTIKLTTRQYEKLVIK